LWSDTVSLWEQRVNGDLFSKLAGGKEAAITHEEGGHRHGTISGQQPGRSRIDTA